MNSSSSSDFEGFHFQKRCDLDNSVDYTSSSDFEEFLHLDLEFGEKRYGLYQSCIFDHYVDSSSSSDSEGLDVQSDQAAEPIILEESLDSSSFSDFAAFTSLVG